MKRFVIGDIHGMYDYLMDVLKKSGFDYENDQLIFMGDVVDRGPEPFKCIDELLKIKNTVFLRGNHDDTFLEYIQTGRNMLDAYPQNGVAPTELKWKELSLDEKRKMTKFFKNQLKYYVSDDNIMFVHGGFNREYELDQQHENTFYWDRDLINAAMSCKGDQKLKTLQNFKKIFVGHTPTIYWGELKPITSGGVTNIDTGSGKGGPLTIMDIDTDQYWQSEYEIEI